MNNQKIGFLALFPTAMPESYVGALLITDENGIPLEFKCTHSVKPTPMQKSLYGKSLLAHIGITLCGLPLLNSISNKPNILIVNTPFLLDIRNKIETPTYYACRVGEIITLNSESEETDKQRLEKTNGEYQPIVIHSHPHFKNDQNNPNHSLSELFDSFDLVEPFERIQKSIEILGNNDSKFK